MSWPSSCCYVFRSRCSFAGPFSRPQRRDTEVGPMRLASVLRGAPVWAVLTAVACMSGCTVGPKYRGPPAVAADAMHSPAFARSPRDGVSSAPALAKWWESLNDPELSHLIEAALRQSPDIHAAEARLRESRAGLRQQRRDALPKGSASAAYLHANLPTTPLGISAVDFYNVGFDATWEMDLFGGTRRAIEAASADAEAVQADLADAQLQLSAEIAEAYIDLRDRQQRIELV